MQHFAHRRPDQFYWVTSLLSARNCERGFCSLIAALVAILGVLPVAMLLSPAGSSEPVSVGVACVVAVLNGSMAAMWARRRWPSRGQSKFFLISTVLATAVTTLGVPDPTTALLGTVAFAVLGFYAAVFHSRGYTVFNLVVAIATAGLIVTRIAGEQGVIAPAAAFVFVVVVNLIAPLVCWTTFRLLEVDFVGRDVDVFTGLHTPAAFYRRVAELIGARTRDDDRFLVLTAVLLDDLPLLTATEGKVRRERAQVAIARALAHTTRKSAVIAQFDANVFVLAEIFTNTKHLGAYADRVQGALSAAPPRMSTSIGMVHAPLPGLETCPPEHLVDQLIAAATQEARLDGTASRPAQSLAMCPDALKMPGEFLEDGESPGA